VAWLQHPQVPQPNLIGLPAFADNSARGVAPALGEHTETILREHDYSAEQIAGLRAEKVII